MRVGVVTNNVALTGGVERCVLEDVTDLVAHGHHVELLARPMAELGDAGLDAYEALGVPIHRASDYHFGVRSAISDVARFVRAGLGLRRMGLDVLWLNRPEYLPWGRAVSVVSGLPLVVQLHHAPNYRTIGPIAGGRTRYVAVSQYMADRWHDVGVPLDRITVVPNGVDVDAFRPPIGDDRAVARAALNLRSDDRVVLYYGRVTASKGVLALLEAWHRLPTPAPLPEAVPSGAAGRVSVAGPVSAPGPRRTVLVLAGHLVHDADAVRAAIARHPEGSVVLLPARDDVVTLLHAADVVAAPSIEHEGFGRVVVEAMATGIPAVTSSSGGTAEILAGGWERFTVDPEDPAALAAALDDALRAVESEPDLAARARSWVADRFTRRSHADGVAAALRASARRRTS